MAQLLRTVLRVCQIIFVPFLIYFALRLLHYHLALTAFPFASALREGATMTTTDALVKGLNPYDMALQPQHTNQYGIVYSLFVWPWAKIFGTTVLVHRMVVAFFILATCALVFFVLQRMSVSILLNSWAVLMLYASLLFPGTSTASIEPGSTAMFLFLLTIFIPWFCRYSYKSLIGSVFIGIVSFYTKPYALLGALVIVSYLFLFISKKKSLAYGSLLLLLFAITIPAVNQIFPAYFDDSFFISANQAPAWSSMERLHMQIDLYKHLHQWTFILIGIFILGYGFKIIRAKSWNNIKQFRMPLVLYAGLCSAFVLYTSLGRHTGATLWYFFQLLSPFLLIGTAWAFNRYAYWPILCIPFLIANLYTISVGHDYKIFNESLAGWPELSQVISEHQHILNSPLIAPLLIEQNKEVFDDGQTEYFLSGGQRNYWMKGLFKEDDRVFIQQMLFFQNIRNFVQNKKFDLIVLQPSLLPLGVGDDIKKFYKYEGELILYAPQDHRPYAVTLWRPL